jgi:AbrB family looped-hinge helix DNA binding protein
MNRHVRISGTSTTTSKGQVTIPKPIRDALGIKDGTPVDWDLDGDQLRVRARTRRLVDFAGILGNPLGRVVTVEEMRNAVLDEADERHRRVKR